MLFLELQGQIPPMGHLPLVLCPGSYLPSHQVAAASLPPSPMASYPQYRPQTFSNTNERKKQSPLSPRSHANLRITYQEVALPVIKTHTGLYITDQRSLHPLGLFVLFLTFLFWETYITKNLPFLSVQFSGTKLFTAFCSHHHFQNFLLLQAPFNFFQQCLLLFRV